MPWAKVKLAYLDVAPGTLCQRPYHNHPRGCPRYGKHGVCPPHAGMWSQSSMEMNRDVYVIWNKFDFGAHVRMMRKRLPHWTRRQLECCIYWQPKARKQLRAETFRFMREFRGRRVYVSTIPEAHGVDVTATMKRAGEMLEWPPVKWTYQVAVAFVGKGEV